MEEGQRAAAGEGIYRCTGGIGETQHVEENGVLAPCSCSPDGTWRKLVEDNTNDRGLLLACMAVGTGHAVFFLACDFVPEVGAELNIEFTMGGTAGRYKISSYEESTEKGIDCVISVVHVGEILETEHNYMARYRYC